MLCLVSLTRKPTDSRSSNVPKLSRKTEPQAWRVNSALSRHSTLFASPDNRSVSGKSGWAPNLWVDGERGAFCLVQVFT